MSLASKWQQHDIIDFKQVAENDSCVVSLSAYITISIIIESVITFLYCVHKLMSKYNVVLKNVI